MDGKCVFRAQFKGRKFRIIELDNPKLAGNNVYWVYEDRRRLDAVLWKSLGAAIGSILMEYSQDVVHEFRRTWL